MRFLEMSKKWISVLLSPFSLLWKRFSRVLMVGLSRFEPISQRVTLWWQAREEREQRVLLWGAGIGCFLFVWLGIFDPLWGAKQKYHQQLETLQVQQKELAQWLPLVQSQPRQSLSDRLSRDELTQIFQAKNIQMTFLPESSDRLWVIRIDAIRWDTFYEVWQQVQQRDARVHIQSLRLSQPRDDSFSLNLAVLQDE